MLHYDGRVVRRFALAERVRPSLPGAAADEHGHAERFGFLQAQPHILEHQAGIETDIEATRQNRIGKLGLGRGVAAATGVEDVDHHLRCDAGLDAERDRFRGDRQSRARQQIVEQFHELSHADLVADIEDVLADLLQHGTMVTVRIVRPGHHDGERAGHRPGDAAADRRVERHDPGFFHRFGDRHRCAGAGRRKIDIGLDPVALDKSVGAQRDLADDIRCRQADENRFDRIGQRLGGVRVSHGSDVCGLVR